MSVTLLLITIGLFKTIFATCDQSYMTFCECVADLDQYRTRNWTDLVIGSVKSENPCQISTIDHGTFENFEEIKLLFVVNRIRRVERKTFVTIGQTLKFLKFHSNNLSHIETCTFSGFRKLSQLSLANNDVESVAEYAFKGSTIKNLDLSRNKMETVSAHAFDGCDIARIVITNNRLTYINPEAFNEHVEVLNLDHNHVESLGHGFGRNLPKLKELTVSHNRLAHVSGISSMGKVKKLDFSFNSVNFVNSQELEELKDLTYLDLSSNKLETFSLKHLKKVKTERMTLLLSYNLLTNLKIKDIKPITITLFGNPWNCDCLTKIEKNLVDFNFTRTKCDLELFSCDYVPICLDQGECKAQPVEDRSDLQRFLKTVNQQKNKLPCDLFYETGPKYVVLPNYLERTNFS